MMNKKMFSRLVVMMTILLGLGGAFQLLAYAGGGMGNDNGLDALTGTCDVPSGTYSTIQSAVDDDCLVINLTAAMYVENVFIQSHSVTIKGQGPANTTVDGNAEHVVFGVSDDSELRLEDLTVMNGEGLLSGGGILNYGSAHLVNTVVRDNYIQFGPGGGIASYGPLWVEDSLVVDNHAQFSHTGANGGGVYVRDTAHFTSTVISGNLSYVGGGIGVDGYTTETLVTIVDSQIIGNKAGNGGGILTSSDETVLILNSLIQQNEAGASGGGILNGGNMHILESLIIDNLGGTFADPFSCGGGILNSSDYFSVNDAGALLIERSEIRDNLTHDDGGGVCFTDYDGNGAIEIRESLIAGNEAMLYGGGFYGWSDTVGLIENSTLVDNAAGGSGGGIFARNLQLINTTVYQNSSPAGGGIFSWVDVALVNSIVGGNISGGDCDRDPSAVFTSLGHNIDSDDSCGLDAAGDLPGTEPVLGPLQNNGGPTGTNALLPGSPAIDAGDNAACPPTDQRGVTRPQGAVCDIGAFEARLLSLTKNAPSVAAAGSFITSTLTVRNNLPVTLTNIILTDTLPANASYVSGGTLVGDVVSWTVPSLTAGSSFSRSFVVTATQTITNSDYRVSASGGYSATGAVPVVTIVAVPITGLSAGNDGPTILGNPTNLMATISSGSDVSYAWDFGDGSTGGGEAVSHLYPAVGVYTAVVTVENSVSTMTATTVVTVVDEPIVGLAIQTNTPVRFGEAAVMTATISAGTNVTYSWVFGDGSGGVGSVVSHTYGMAGSYTVTVTATNSVGMVVETAVVVVLEEPMWSVYMPVALKP